MEVLETKDSHYKILFYLFEFGKTFTFSANGAIIIAVG